MIPHAWLRVVDMLRSALLRSMVMLEAGAYMHWYEAYGVSAVEFDEAYRVIGCVIAAYDDYGGV